jgi:prolyl oligopeptidase
MTAQPVRKTIGGITFDDRFAHLHDDSAEALEWQWARDAEAQAAVAASPSYRAVHDRLLGLNVPEFQTVPRRQGGKWFGFGTVDGEHGLWVSDDPQGGGRLVVPLRALADGDVLPLAFEPSPNGRFVALTWGVDGNTTVPWTLFETATGRRILDTPPAPFVQAHPGWLPDESGFWFADRDDAGSHRLRFHPVTGNAGERPDVIIPHSLVAQKHSSLTPQVSPNGRQALLVTDLHEHIALVFIDLDTLATRPFLPEGFDGECDGGWLDDETYVARVTNGGSRGRIVAIPVATSTDMSSWSELVPAGDGFLVCAGIVAGRLYVFDHLDTSVRVRMFDTDGRHLQTLPLETPGSAPSILMDRAVRPTQTLAIIHSSFTRSPVLFTHDARTGELHQHGEAAHRLDDVSVEQRFAISRDGTRIPYFVVRPNGLDSGRPHPLFVHGYGGFNVSLLPAFPTNFVPAIEAGGIFVQACLRGGGEYGRAWHDGGRLENKQNTYDDLAAIAEALIADGVSVPELMAFQGLSNGGLTSGVAIVQQPHLWRAVAPVVPLLDMIEPLPLTPATAPIRAVFYEDYGDATAPGVAERIMRYSPYHNIVDGVAYPAVFQVFGENDTGCMPFHGRKFTARLDEASSSGRPIHLRVERGAGHMGFTHAKTAARNAEWLSFLMDEVGLKAAGS